MMTSLETNRYLNIDNHYYHPVMRPIHLRFTSYSKLLLHIIIGIIIYTQEFLISNLLMVNLKFLDLVKL